MNVEAIRTGSLPAPLPRPRLRGRRRAPSAAASLVLGALLAACAPTPPPAEPPAPAPPPPEVEDAAPEAGAPAPAPEAGGPLGAAGVPDSLLLSPSWETLRATLWVQRAAEFDGVSLGTFRAAADFLDDALAEPSFTAAVEQVGPVDGLPPAVIVDVDETVLDNAPFQARMILTGETFGPETWDAWVGESAAEAMPGAVEFAREAASRGVTVFYVTNRDDHLEEPTRRNLERLGFPLEADAPGGAAGADAPTPSDVVLTRGEREGWGSDKASRRAWVAERYRVLALLGDDLNDFLSVRGMDVEERNGAYRAFEERVGRGWFFLPNPVYGSWESALLRGAGDLGPAERRRLLLERLDPRR